jgi:hypothetical protein
MSTTRAFEIPSAVKAASIKARFRPSTEQPKGASTPVQKDDLITRIGTDKKHDVSDGLTMTIDVLPDFRWILMSLMYYSNVFYSSIDVKNRSKTSPATITFYFLSILYAHLLVSDLFLRHSPSYFASSFMADYARREYLEFLLELPVPEILMKFIETLTVTSDPRRPHIQFCPSLAGFSAYHDFGRIFPVSIFAHAHHLAATMRSTDPTESIWFKFFNFRPTTDWSVGGLFGQHLGSTSNVHDYNSKLFQSLEALFNPVIERSIQRRNTLAPTPMHPSAYSMRQNTPYVILLAADAENMNESRTILESVSQSLASVLSFKGQLGTLYDSLSGLDILRHGYSSFALPTWYFGTPTAPSSSKALTIQSDSQRATSLLFLQARTPANTTSLKYPTDASTIDKILYLVKKVTKSEDYPPTDDFRLFKGPYDVLPRIRVLDPYDVNVSVLSSVIYCGLIIESLELDGSSVTMPDADIPLDDDNSQLLQSAIPLTIIRRASAFTGSATTGSHLHATHRVQGTAHSQKAAQFFNNVGENRLGTFDDHADEAIPTELPAFRIREHTTWFSRMFNVIGYSTAARDIDAEDTNPRIGTGTVIVWSPYRYVAPTWNFTAPASHTYMVTNFRTIYGSNVPLSEIAHPATLLPIN